MRNEQKGFSLIELLIVVAIIMITAAIAMPNLLHSEMATNEASAVATLRTLNTVSSYYSTIYGTYETDLTALGPAAAGTAPTSATADLVDNLLANDPATKAGYTFAYTFTAGYYTITATPVTVGVTGQRYFFTNQSGVIRVNPAGPATAASSPL